MAVATTSKKMIMAGGVELEVDIRGTGQPMLLLSGEEQLENSHAFVDELAQRFQVIIPSAPGFGNSPRPEWLTNTDDISYVYLDLLESLGLNGITVAGFGHGGWIAAELAVKDDSLIDRMIITSAYGVKIGGPFDVDIQDIWINHPSKVMAMKWHDPAKGKRDFSSMSEEQLTIVARNTETFARYCWEPYMHNPKLRHRLHRIQVPTLFIWGENDGMTSVAYGKAYAGLVPGAKFETIANAGHHPHLEQNEAFMKVFNAFTG